MWRTQKFNYYFALLFNKSLSLFLFLLCNTPCMRQDHSACVHWSLNSGHKGHVDCHTLISLLPHAPDYFSCKRQLDDDEDLAGDFSPSSGAVSEIPGVSGSLESHKVSFLFFSLKQQITDHLTTFSSIIKMKCTSMKYMPNSWLSGTKWPYY